jgi:hypothetical protein
LGAALATALTSVAGFYLFADFAPSLAGLPLRSAPLLWLKHEAPSLRLPVPAAFLSGLDLTLATDRGYHYIVAFGRRWEGGTVWYFPGLWLFKTPALLWLLQVVGLVAFVRKRLWRENPGLAFLALNLGLTLAFFCLFFRTQVGYRYVLMCVPLSWLLAAAGLDGLGERARRAFLVAAGVGLLENALYWGNPLSFTNALLWPKRDAYRVMADSNLDWAQNNDKIQGWIGARGIALDRLDPMHLLPGDNVIPLNSFAGVFDWEKHRWAREHLEPKAALGDTHLLLEATAPEFDAFMDTRRIRPLSGAATYCDANVAGARVSLSDLQPGIPFLRTSLPDETQTWIVCVETPAGADISLEVFEGKLQFGRYAGGWCGGEHVSQGKQVWQRLEPGLHALCVEPLFAEDRPYPIRAGFRLHRGAASLSLVAGPRHQKP